MVIFRGGRAELQVQNLEHDNRSELERNGDCLGGGRRDRCPGRSFPQASGDEVANTAWSVVVLLLYNHLGQSHLRIAGCGEGC